VVKAGSVCVYGESLGGARTQTGLPRADLRPSAYLPERVPATPKGCVVLEYETHHYAMPKTCVVMRGGTRR